MGWSSNFFGVKGSIGSGSEQIEYPQRLPISRSSHPSARLAEHSLDVDGVHERVKGYVRIRVRTVFQDTFTEIIQALEARLQEFKQQNSSEQNLLIIYYSGHGFLDLQNRMHRAEVLWRTSLQMTAGSFPLHAWSKLCFVVLREPSVFRMQLPSWPFCRQAPR
jgi:hypothetical protein